MDILSTLQECSLRGISFPIITIKEAFGHDTPQHKSVDRDGAFVENTGRNPFVFSIVAPFYATFSRRGDPKGQFVKVDALRPGNNEKWSDLYPGRFELLRNACIDRTTAPFVHPLYGEFNVKVMDWESSINADERGGQLVSLTVIETRDDGVKSAFTPSTQSFARSAAIDLDSQLAKLSPSPKVFTSSDKETSFTDVVEALLRVKGNTAVQTTQALTTIDRTIGKLSTVAASVSREASVLKTDPLTSVTKNIARLGPGAARIWTNCQTLKASLLDIRRSLSDNGSKTISVYVVPSPVMLPILASRLKTTVVELQALNPVIPRIKNQVPTSAAIRYYKKG